MCLKKLKTEFIEWCRALLRSVPGEVGCALRNRLYGYNCSPDVRVLSNVIIYYPSRLTIGRGTGIACSCQLNAGGELHIGEDVLIGPGTMIWTQNHVYRSGDSPIRFQGTERAKVTIEDDVWIGAGAIIVPGVTVSQGTVVAAGAVVTKTTEPYSVVAGSPAREIGQRTVSQAVRV